MHQSFDQNIRRLVAAINAFEGLTVIGGCAGHLDPQPDQWPEGAWYAMFTVQRTDEGWFALEFLAWTINNDYRMLPLERPSHKWNNRPIGSEHSARRLT
jgi:hypothetical protein